MIDLSRRLAHNAYNKRSNPTGIVDLGSATNELMLDELQNWLGKNKRSDDKAKCKPSCPSPTPTPAMAVGQETHEVVRPGLTCSAAENLSSHVLPL